MKKALSILMVFTLTFFTINPLPPVFAAAFTGTVTGSAGSADNERQVTVTNAPNQAILKLYTGSGGAALQTETITGTTHTFLVKDFGKYFVTSTTLDSEKKEIVSDPSPTVEVKPGPVTISQENLGPDQILVINAIKGAELILYNDRTGYIPQTTIADTNGHGVFTQVPPGLNYKAKQKTNGVESTLSTDAINILPKIVRYTSSETAGPKDDQGTITILESTPGSTIRLYDVNEELLDSKPVEVGGVYPFTGLKAGTYKITQQQNNAESPKVTVNIVDAEIPLITLITLNGDNEETITLGDSYSDLGATATDNIDDSETLTKSITVINPVSNATPPGIYYATYNVQDSIGNKAVEVKRKVTILPKQVALDPVNTFEANEDKDGKYGQIKLEDVYSESILYLYQDPDGKLIRTITDASSPIYTINDVPVGKDYYVIQEFTNENGSVVQSKPSTRIEIKDTTKPVLSLLNSDPPINLVMGERYIEYGATASDNVDSTNADTAAELNSNIDITGTVNTNIPGTYTITYNVKDKAKNNANPITRVVDVSPTAVIAIGSTADFGEVGVKNALPGATLNLYESKDIDMTDSLATYVLTTIETTHVFKIINITPGSYFVTQTANAFTSKPSNVVEVVDIDRPYITLKGPEKLTFVLGESKEFFDGTTNTFTDPGATAYDYLDGDLTSDITKVITPSILSGKIIEPGSYTITYSVTAKSPRLTRADNKFRTIIVAPPKTATPTSTFGSSVISAGGLFPHTTTQVKLYNTYGQLMETKSAKGSSTIEFDSVIAGLGYYVTQTVNGIESASSEPVNVNLFEEAKDSALITSFEFTSVNASGVIDQEAKTITIIVPNNTDVTSLKPSFISLGNVYVGFAKQISGTNTQNFTNPVKYTVTNVSSEPKEYTVQVNKSGFTPNVWETSLSKNIAIYNTTNTRITLNPAEKLLAKENGMSFISNDRAIHVPAANVIETTNPTLTVSAPTPASVTIYSDPLWRNSVESVTELKWGNSTEPFMQPIEIEMPNPNNKVFAKLVRENGALYAIIQPSDKSGSNIVGLASEPGTYALVDKIFTPTIVPIGDNTYTLSTTVSGGQIYYTTSSSEVAFDRSARKGSSVSSYLFDGSPNDLSNWQTASNRETVSAPNGEIYAFVMKDQMISPLNNKIKTAIEWEKEILTPTYETYKVLSISFSAEVEKKALYSGNIYVIDDVTGNKVPTTLSLSSDRKTIRVVPNAAYTPNKQYTLYIEPSLKGSTANNEFLKQSFTHTFVVK